MAARKGLRPRSARTRVRRVRRGPARRTDRGGAVCQYILRLQISYVSKVLGRRRGTGETTAKPQRCHVPRKLTGQLTAIQERVEARPDATIAELRSWLQQTHKVSASATLVWETLAHLDLTRKKKTLHAAEQNRPDVAKARQEWRERHPPSRAQSPSLNPGKLIFIDET